MTKLLFWLVIIVGVAGFVIYKFHPSILGLQVLKTPTKAVAGASTNIFSPEIQSSLGLLQQQVTHLSPKDISTSSPQVQAILKTLQSLPQGEAHDMCEKLCGSYLK
jgi:hypothetical protein